MKELYVVNCCRTAVGSFGGSLKNTPAAQLGSIVVKEALKRANVAPENVDELMFGCILTAGLGQNVARQVGVGAGLPYSVPAYTVGMVCGSGMKSVIEAGRAILAGDADIVVCGGTENMSAAPYAAPDARWGARMGDKKLVDTMIKDGLWDAYNNYHMGTTAENICDVWGITREELDAFGAASQQKTEAAQAAGRFDDEIVPVPVKVKKEIVEFKKDEFPRAGSTLWPPLRAQRVFFRRRVPFPTFHARRCSPCPPFSTPCRPSTACPSAPRSSARSSRRWPAR